GVLLDHIRLNGENKELVDEVTALAKKYGITTPYTSYLIVPDGPAPVAKKGPAARVQEVPKALAGDGKGGKPKPVLELAKKDDSDRGKQRGFYAERDLAESVKREKESEGKSKDKFKDPKSHTKALEQKNAYDEAKKHFGKGDKDRVQTGKLGV